MSTAARPTIGAAVLWIAEEDGPADNPSVDDLAGLISVCLVADLFGKPAREIAQAVYGVRNPGHICVTHYRMVMQALLARGLSNDEARAYLERGVK